MAEKIFNTGISYSQNPNVAAYEAITRAISFSDKKPELGLLFCSKRKFKGQIPALAKAAEQIFKQINPDCNWVGCASENIDGCMAFVLSHEKVSSSIGLGSAANRDPGFSGKRAVQNAVSSGRVSQAMAAYISAAAVSGKMPKVELLQPYFALAFLPEDTNHNEIFRSLKDSMSPNIPLLKFPGELFSNGVVLKNTTVLVLESFEQPGDWNQQNIEAFSTILD